MINLFKIDENVVQKTNKPKIYALSAFVEKMHEIFSLFLWRKWFLKFCRKMFFLSKIGGGNGLMVI